jgi:hypothetical protein
MVGMARRAITTIRMDTAITRTDTTDLIDTMVITEAPTMCIEFTAITAIIVTIVTNVAWKTNSTELARMRFRASSFFANLLRSFRNSTS